jgi:HEAT repeat protein
VRVLGGAGGPVGFRDPFYRTLKEDVGPATLLSLAKGDEPLIRPYAVEALGILGENSDEVITVLTAALRDKDPRLRFRGVRGLGHLLISNNKPEEATIIISALKNALSDAEAEVRYAVTETLRMYATGRASRMDGLMKDVVPPLVAALEDKAGYVRSGAASALGRIGPLTGQVVPSLVRLLNSLDPSDRESATRALGEISSHNNSFGQSGERERVGKEIGRALLTAADDPSKSVRYEVAEGLGEVGAVERGVIRALIKMTKDPSRGVRTAAAKSLSKLETERTRIVPALARMLKVPDEDAEVIEYVLRGLGEIGREARSAAPEVRRLLRSENPRIREYAGYTLEKIERLPAQGGSHER